MRNINNFLSFKKIKLFKLIFLLLFPFVITSFPLNAQAICIFWCKAGQRAGRDAARELRAAIEDGISIEFGLDDRDIQTIANRTRGLVGYTTLQAEALIRHGGEEYRRSLSHSIDELTAYTKTLDKIVEQRLDQLDRVTEERIRQTFEEIERQTLLISSELKDLIRATEEAVKSSASHISYEIQEITRTASDELAELLGITRDHVDQLLDASEEKLLNILSVAGDEVAEIVKLISKETQKNIKVVGKESRETIGKFGEESRETTIVTLDKFDKVVQSILEEGGNELRVILDDSRVLIADIKGHAIDVTDNLSDETQKVIEVGAENLEELASHMAEEVLRINEAIKESRLQVIEGGLFFIDRTADLILAVGSTGAGIFFLFFSSYGFTRGFLQWPLPERYTQRVMVFSFMGLTIVASFVPFVFSIPSMRARVLIPMAQATAFSEVVPGIGERIPRKTEFNPRQGQFSNEGFNNGNCSILAVENVRSEPSSYQGNKTVILRASKQHKVWLHVTGKQTKKGWIEIETSEAEEGWVHKSVISNYEDMQDCVDNNEDIDVDIVPDIIPPEPPTPVREPSIQSSSQPAQRNELSREAARSLIQKWLEAKKEIFAPPFNRQLASEMLTGDAYEKWFREPVDWLDRGDYYYTFGTQQINSIESFDVDGKIAKIDVVVTEERTFCKNQKPQNENTAFDRRLVHYTFKIKDDKWKIADYSSDLIWEQENSNQSCDL